MTSRREFLKRAGFAGGLTALPLLSDAHNWIKADNLGGGFSPEEIRRSLLVPQGRIYLNTGSLGPMPKPLLDNIFALMQQLEQNPVSENWGPLGTRMEAVRGIVAEFIHAEKDEIVLTRNTTEGLELVCQSLRLAAGDEILTTTLEHGGGEVGLEFLERTQGAVVRKIELPLPPNKEEEIIKTISEAITPKTRLVMLSHVNTVTGLLMPMDKIAALTRPKGIFLLCDGAQAPGLTPIDVKKLNVDAYASSGHKWLLGPKETGFLYIRKDVQSLFHPVFTSSGFDSYSKSSGTRNVALIIGLGEAIRWQQQLGVDQTLQYTTRLRDHCQRELAKLRGLRMISPESGPLSTSIVSFSLESARNHEIYEHLKAADIIVKVLPQHNAIRISCHLFVSMQDIDKFIGSLRPLL